MPSRQPRRTTPAVLGLVFAAVVSVTVAAGPAQSAETHPRTAGSVLRLEDRSSSPSCPVTRVSGATRFATSVVEGRAAFPTGDAVVIVSADARHMADGVVAAPLAFAKRAPVLLTERASLPGVVAQDIADRGVRTAYLIGGTIPISTSVEDQLADLGVTDVVRLGGDTRYETAAMVADAMDVVPSAAIIASGEYRHLIDALVAGGPAARQGWPILLTRKDSLPGETAAALDRLSVPRTYVIGGTIPIHDDVTDALAALDHDPQRLAGGTLYDTARAVADEFAAVGTGTVLVASGERDNIIDALGGGTFGRVIVLSGRDRLPATTATWLRGHAPYDRVIVVGGQLAVSESAYRAVEGAVCGEAPADSCTGQAGSPTCEFWTGRVVAVQDGDTLDVDVWGDGTSAPKRVRVTGIQAMEQSVYSSVPSRRRGECHALEATARFEQLAGRGQVIRLAAQDPGSTTGGRLRRSVSVQVGGGWQDVGRILVREGHALPLLNSVEHAWNAIYRAEAERAADARVNLWDNDYCGSGNNQGSNLMVMVNWDAEGDDNANLNGEWVRLRNMNSSTSISLSGWWLRDSDLRRFTFPTGTTIPAGGSVDVFVGAGTSTASRFYWGQTSPVFDNVSHDARAMGDGAYLFDHQGDLRWSMTYPCATGCASALQGRVDVRAQPAGAEYVDITNTSPGAVDLMGHLLVNFPYSYAFRSPHIVQPGQTLRVYTGRGTSTGLVRYWGKPGPILDNVGETVSLRTYDDIEVDCFAWGTGRC